MAQQQPSRWPTMALASKHMLDNVFGMFYSKSISPYERGDFGVIIRRLSLVKCVWIQMHGRSIEAFSG
jgi:hypothetical protein